MNIEIKEGKKALPLRISNEELKTLILSVIDEKMKQKFTCSVYQYALIDSLMTIDALVKAANTTYAGYDLTDQDELNVNKVLWNMINDRKLILNLLPGTYYATVQMELIKIN